MASYKFIYDGGSYGDHEVEFSFSNIENLDTVLEKFTLFLKGCGFHIEDGVYLDFVSEKDTPDWFIDEPNQPSAEFPECEKLSVPWPGAPIQPKEYDFQPLDDAMGLKVHRDVSRRLYGMPEPRFSEPDTNW